MDISRLLAAFSTLDQSVGVTILIGIIALAPYTKEMRASLVEPLRLVWMAYKGRIQPIRW